MKYLRLGRVRCEKDESLLSISIYLNTLASEEKRRVTEEALRSLIESRWDCHEIALVDNGSEDETFSFLLEIVKSYDLEKLGKRVHLIRLPKNLGFARANNIAYFSLRDLVKPKYVAVVNDDLAVYPLAFRYLVKALNLDDRIAGVQGLVKRWDENFPDSGPFFWETYDIPGTVISPNLFKPTLSLKPLVVSYLDGAFSVYKEKAIREVGFFETFAFLYGDDNYLGHKLWKRGYVLLYVPVLVGKHARGSTKRNLKMKETFLFWGDYTNMCLSMKLTKFETLYQILVGSISIPLELLRGLVRPERVVRARAIMFSLLNCPPVEPCPSWIRHKPELSDLLYSLASKFVEYTRRHFTISKISKEYEKIYAELESSGI